MYLALQDVVLLALAGRCDGAAVVHDVDVAVAHDVVVAPDAAVVHDAAVVGS